MATKRKFPWLRWLIILLILVGGGVGFVAYLKDQPDEGPKFITATITRGDVTQAVTATGTINPLLNVQVGSQVSGIILKLYVDFNSKVKEGQLLAQIDPATYEANLAQVEGDLASAKANLNLAEVNARRAEQLVKDKLISQSDYDNTMAALLQAQATVQVRESNVKKVKVDLSRCSIYSPVDGIVIDRKVDVGQTVAASMNAPLLFMIANDLSKMQINAAVAEADIGTVEEGQAVTFTVDAFPGRTFNGKVTQVRNSPTTVQNVVTYDTIIEVSNPDLKLKPGMTANVSVISASKPDVLKIPNAALRFRPPEPSTNQTWKSKMAVALGLKKPAGTNTVVMVRMLAGVTNTPAAASTITWTGNETREELFAKMREAREKGEEVPESARTKMREYAQAGGFGGGGGGGGPGGGGGGKGGGGRGGGAGGGSRPTSSRPAVRTIYTLVSNAPAAGQPATTSLGTIQVKTGISDGSFTEVIEGLNEGETIVTSVALAQTGAPGAAGAPQQNVNPFGGGSRFGGR